MASKTAPKGRSARKKSARKRSAPQTDSSARKKGESRAAGAAKRFTEPAQAAKLLTPAQAIELYKSNAALALAVIDAAIEGGERVRRKQLEGVAQARDFQDRHTRSAAGARDPQALLAVGQGAAQEAMEKSMHYWSEMFDLIVEIQKRLFTLIEEQMEGVPGVRETKAAMAMLPDLAPMKNVVAAMQGVVSSGGSTLESMRRVMTDFAKMAQGPGASR